MRLTKKKRKLFQFKYKIAKNWLRRRNEKQKNEKQIILKQKMWLKQRKQIKKEISIKKEHFFQLNRNFWFYQPQMEINNKNWNENAS